MDTLTPLRHAEGCAIDQAERYIRAAVGPGLAVEVQECYRGFITECLQRGCTRALIVGRARGDAFYHLALRDALRAMAVHGVPGGFRIALVAETPELIAVYDAALLEAERCGIEAKRLHSEVEADLWLGS